MKAKSISCEKCNWSASPVHRVEGVPKPRLKGWYCSHCGHFIKATGREPGLSLPDKK